MEISGRRSVNTVGVGSGRRSIKISAWRVIDTVTSERRESSRGAELPGW